MMMKQNSMKRVVVPPGNTSMRDSQAGLYTKKNNLTCWRHMAAAYNLSLADLAYLSLWYCLCHILRSDVCSYHTQELFRQL